MIALVEPGPVVTTTQPTSPVTLEFDAAANDADIDATRSEDRCGFEQVEESLVGQQEPVRSDGECVTASLAMGELR